jgi:hypothetical protein
MLDEILDYVKFLRLQVKVCFLMYCCLKQHKPKLSATFSYLILIIVL